MSEKTIKNYFRVSKRKHDGKSVQNTSKKRKLESEVDRLLPPPPRAPLATPPSSPSITSRALKSPRKPSSSPTVSSSSPAVSRGGAAVRLALEKFGKQPTTPIPDSSAPLPVFKVDTPPSSVTASPKLGRFDVFEFTSPQKSSRRRLDYSLLTQKTPAEVKLDIAKKSLASTSKNAATPTINDRSTPISKGSSSSSKHELTVPTTRSSTRSANNSTSSTRSSIRSTNSTSPAYQRLHALTAPVATPTTQSTAPPLVTKHSSNLTLPYDYQVLSEKFQSVETMADMMQKRGQICPFDRLKESVQKITKKNFNHKNLGQMKHVYPVAHILRQEKLPMAKHLYHLTIQCSAHNGEGSGKGIPEELPFGKGISNPAIFVKRNNLFRKNLTSIVAEYHKKFLLTLDPPVEVSVDKVYRWHPLFQLDSVPDVIEAELPKPPDVEQYCSASTPKHVIDEEAKKASVKMASAYQEAKKEIEEESVTKNNLLKGVSSGLLERIRLKEVANAKAEIMRNPEKEKELAMVSRLPEMCRIIKSLFVSEKKVALTIECITNKIIDSHKSGLETNQVEEHIELLVKILPNWLKKLKVRGTWYLKVDKSVDFNSSLKRLEVRREELKRSC